ncbi:MAG: alpha/beta hydrolase [Acetobacterium sp. MES1]|uniref:alpha/beta fold hydrolase n=1 Tax=Acetobacterium sp. MES1 TaxID=1899015 RepID=UPI000B9D4E0E|nr:alpha/beta hydrolase [Acetobacterium sp. MES1]OXS24910.1 MAG: alpha/beta hydrolase [Acetobacterium sp. MES1]
MALFFVVLLGLLSIISTLLIVVFSGKMIPYTNASGQVLPGSLAEKSWVTINGVEMGMIIKSRDIKKPVLLFVHGGPGMPEYWLNESHPAQLDELFTVVWWDQRGAGLSYDNKISAETMTTAQLVADTIAVTKYLCQRFRQDKIHLMGHSFGTYLAIQAAVQAPQLYHAYIGVAQSVNLALSEELAYEWLLEYYRDDKKNRLQLEKFPYGTAAYERIRDRVMHEAGIGTTHKMYSVVSGIFIAVMKHREYTLKEKFQLWQGKAFSQSSTLNEEFRQANLSDLITRLDLPVLFFSGAYDYTVNHHLSEIFLEDIKAPQKHFYLFEDSAHSPIFEEPEAVLKILKALIA